MKTPLHLAGRWGMPSMGRLLALPLLGCREQAPLTKRREELLATEGQEPISKKGLASTDDKQGAWATLFLTRI